MLDLNPMVMGGCLCECDGEMLNATWGNNTRPAETFCSTSPESFWQPASFCLHRAQRCGQRMTLSSPPCTVQEGKARWQTDWPLCISKCLHLFVPFSVLFCNGSFYGCFLMIYAIMEHSKTCLRILFCVELILLSSSISMKASDIKQSWALKVIFLY